MIIVNIENMFAIESKEVWYKILPVIIVIIIKNYSIIITSIIIE